MNKYHQDVFYCNKTYTEIPNYECILIYLLAYDYNVSIYQ